jgi:hypothetical protein
VDARNREGCGMNPNTEYEILAQEIYQSLHKSEGINTIDVQHNIKVKGTSGCEHQIDVFWEFEMVGELHRVAIECKNYSNQVSIGKIRDFKAALDDIGNTKGIFVSKVGYQRGAIEFAEHCGISLKEMRPPTEEDWKGRVKDIVFDISMFTTNIKGASIKLDEEWIMQKTKYDSVEELPTRVFANTDELFLIDSKGKKINNMTELVDMIPHNWQEKFDAIHSFDFEDAYMLDDSNEKLKVNSVTFTYDFVSQTESVKLEGNLVAKAILKDVKTQGIKFFDNSGGVK